MIYKKNKIKIPIQYKFLQEDNEGLFAASLNGKKIGFINSKGEVKIPFLYDEVCNSGFNYGLCAVAIENKWGYIDLKGNLAIPLKFDYADHFEKYYETKAGNGRHRSHIYYINRKGEIIIQINEVY